ncbi:unnamed protein product [Durusdinium trenchii]|uniref:Uncharacterized protein n=1 Tax=Durusdinium trenchii TaxID=1381693 RepID=A0ABP0QCU7_9DINO
MPLLIPIKALEEREKLRKTMSRFAGWSSPQLPQDVAWQFDITSMYGKKVLAVQQMKFQDGQYGPIQVLGYSGSGKGKCLGSIDRRLQLLTGEGAEFGRLVRKQSGAYELKESDTGRHRWLVQANMKFHGHEYFTVTWRPRRRLLSTVNRGEDQLSEYMKVMPTPGVDVVLVVLCCIGLFVFRIDAQEQAAEVPEADPEDAEGSGLAGDGERPEETGRGSLMMKHKAAADGRIRIPKGFTDPTSQVAAARHGTDMGDEGNPRPSVTASSDAEGAGPRGPRGSSKQALPGSGGDGEKFGDLSDVPPQRLKEVKAVIKSTRDLWQKGRVGGVSHLREWIDTLQRLSGLSRQVCLQLCVAMSRCLAAERKDEKPSRVDLQQAFVRMGGSRHACHMMMLRLHDERIVAQVIRLLAASVENAPLAAEALMRDNLDNVKLVMRSMERHLACPEVAEAGCLLIGHLCSCTATESGELMPVRVKAHRDSQNTLCREGAVEIIVDIMCLYMKDVRTMTNRAHMLMQEKLKEAEGKRQRQDELDMGLGRPDRAAVNMFGKLGGALKERILKVQANIELRQAWQKLLDLEVSVGRLLNAALQALLLLVVGNTNAIRQLSGNFYTYHLNKLLDLGEAFIGAAADAAKDAKERKEARRGMMRGEESDGEDYANPDKSLRIRGKVGRVEVPEGQERRSMLSMETLSLKCQVLVDALRGHSAKDRPTIVCKACRLFLLILEHHKGLIMKANDQGKNQCRRVELQLRNPAPSDDLHFTEIFKPLESVLAAFISVLKTHNENSPVISAVFQVIAKLRELALLSVPAGMHLNGSNAEKQWQVLIANAGEGAEYVIRKAAQRLAVALEETKKGDHRIETFHLKPNQIEGNGEWLTPRMREEVREMIHVGEVLAADAFKAAWAEQEEPLRWEKIYQKQQQLKAQEKYREDKRKAKEMGISYEEFHQLELEEQARKEAADDDSSSSGMSGFEREDNPQQGVAVEEEDEVLNFDEEDVMGDVQWLRAIGFGSHDEDDFDRLWRKPITDILLRNIPERAPPDSKWAIEAAQRRRELVEQAEKTGEPLEDPDMDELLQIEMLESVQGKLKIRALVRPQDQIQANNIETRGKELTDPKGASKVIVQEVAKGFRRSGYLLPKYGFACRIQKRAASLTQLAREAQKTS